MMAKRSWDKVWNDVDYIDMVTDETSYLAGDFVVVWDRKEDIAYTVKHRYDVLNYLSDSDEGIVP